MNVHSFKRKTDFSDDRKGQALVFRWSEKGEGWWRRRRRRMKRRNGSGVLSFVEPPRADPHAGWLRQGVINVGDWSWP